MLSIGMRAHDMPAANFEELISKIGGLDLKCIQLALKKSITDISVENEALTPGLAFHLKKILHDNNVNVSVLGCYLNMATPDEEELKQSIVTYKANMRFAKYLGCAMVGTETGAVNVEYKYTPENRTDKALEILVKSVAELADYADKLGVTFGIEPVSNHIIYDVKRARQLLDIIDSPNVQIILDPINIFTEENYVNQEEIMEEAFDLLGENIIAVHVKDFIIKDNKKIGVPIGEGIFNYDKLLSLLKKHKPYIHVLMEDTTPDNVVASRDFILNKFNSL
ncbi:MAG: sugar phosphate isomerase/epimerase [Clostridiales bacterium]|nr:sugar phosphate isomerase/epimerase [Clostridiales bacterium]